MGLPAWLTGAAIFAALAASWAKIKWLIGRVTSLFVVRIQLERELARAIALYCWKRLRRSPFGARRYSCFHEFVRPEHRNQIVGFETIGNDPIVFWKGLWPMLLGNAEKPDGGSGDDSPSSAHGRQVNISFIRGTFKMDKLIIEALDMFNKAMRQNENRDSRFFIEHVYGQIRFGSKEDQEAMEDRKSGIKTVNHLAIGDRRVLKWKLDDLGPENTYQGSALNHLAFPDEIHTMIQEARHWLLAEDWYRSKGIPWKRGWLLYGAPGTGKTSLVRAMGQDLNMPVWVYDIASLSNEEMTSSWCRMLSHVPCIALIEDLDNVFEGRRNISSDFSGAMTFDALLNVLDGVEPSNGVFIIVTTNRINKLDAALGVPQENSEISTRPGRIDRAIKLTELDEACRRRIAERVLDECPEKIDDLVAGGEGDTGAQFQERCMRVALADHWTKKDLTAEVEVPDHDRPVVGHRWDGRPVYSKDELY